MQFSQVSDVDFITKYDLRIATACASAKSYDKVSLVHVEEGKAAKKNSARKWVQEQGVWNSAKLVCVSRTRVAFILID